MSCKCGADLTKTGSVVRRYHGHDAKIEGSGHYTQDGDFEPDETVAIPDGAQTFDGDDFCFACGRVVG